MVQILAIFIMVGDFNSAPARNGSNYEQWTQFYSSKLYTPLVSFYA